MLCAAATPATFAQAINGAEPSGSVSAVRVLNGGSESNSMDRIESLLRLELNATIVSSGSARRAGLVIFRAPDTSARPSVELRLGQLLQRHAKILRRVPVVETPDAYAVPTGKIIVQFRSDADLDRAPLLWTGMGLKVVQQPTAFRPGRFVVETDSKASSMDAVSLANRISSRPEVQFAEADMLSILTSPAPRGK